MKIWVAALAALTLAACLWLEFQRLTIKPWPPHTFDTAEDEFKYGSIGAEVDGFPYVVWRELPTIFADRMPGGWSHFGFITEPGHELPIGVSVRTTGVERVGFNCATCHTARIDAGGRQIVALGAPAAQLDIQAYIQFLAAASSDPRLTADAVEASAERAGRPLGWLQRQILRNIVMPRLREQSATLRQGFAWMRTRAPHGPGRTDAGNVWRARWDMHPEQDGAVGTVDFPSVWQQRIRLNGWSHWDGNNSSLDERNYSAALAGGATDWLLDRRAIDAQSDWLMDLRPPPFPVALDRSAVERGRAVYARAGCGQCHDAGSARTGQTTALNEIGTDPERLNLFTSEMVRRFGEVGAAYSWRFRHYRRSDGYANMPLDGIWARAPYLHNGSVPDLAALLSPPDERPRSFRRGCATYDTVRGGYACSSGFFFDTSLRGNGNGGHLFGTDLPAADRASLLEFLKSL